MPKHTSRHRILEYLESREQPISAAELSRALKMTPANARYHLGLLVKDSRAQVVGQIPALRRGRPMLLYSPASRAASHNLDGLVHILLTKLFALAPPQAQTQLLAEIGQAVLASENPPTGSLMQRLTHAVQRLNQLHYAARWEARSPAPRVVLGHCPYAAIINMHPELCQMDASILQTALGVSVSQQTKLEPDGRGLISCSFLVGPLRVTAG